MLSETLTTARAAYYQAVHRYAGAQLLYEALLSASVLSGPAFEQARVLLTSLTDEKKAAWRHYLQAVETDTQARQQQQAQAQQASYGISFVVSPAAEYATA